MHTQDIAHFFHCPSPKEAAFISNEWLNRVLNRASLRYLVQACAEELGGVSVVQTPDPRRYRLPSNMEYIWRSFGEPRSIKLLAAIKHSKKSLISSVFVIYLDILWSMVLLLHLIDSSYACIGGKPPLRPEILSLPTEKPRG